MARILRRGLRDNVMIDYQIDEETILMDEVSDEAVQAAAFVALGGLNRSGDC